MEIKFVTFKEVVELFVGVIYPQIKRERETPKFNIIFQQDAFDYFEEVKNNPFQKKDVITPDIKDEDIDLLRCFDDSLTIYVKDFKLFFTLLTDIINNTVLLYNDYFVDTKDGRMIAIYILRRIWLRMGITDFNDVELFLSKQLEFVKNRIFFDLKLGKQVFDLECFNVYGLDLVNTTFDESTRALAFTLEDNNGVHTLPRIYYDVARENNEDICYVYAIQNKGMTIVNKGIQRLLYKLNARVENLGVHPNQVMALISFLNLLESRGISKIKVSTRQVFSYHYHELLSEKAKKDFEKKWHEEKFKYIKSLSFIDQKEYWREYESDKKWYLHIVDKMDDIERRKTEKLFDIFYRVMEHLPDLELKNDLDVQLGYLVFEFKKRDVKR